MSVEAEGMRTIGFIGAGRVGSQLARLAVRHGYRVVVSNSRDPHTLHGLVSELGGNAAAATPEDAAAAADLAVVAIPLRSIPYVPVEPLAGGLVIDTGNYYPFRDGRIPRLDAREVTTAGLLQEHLPHSMIVKAFNHIWHTDLTTKNTQPGTRRRRALAVYGDSIAARQSVARLIDQFVFDPYDAGPLAESWRIESDQRAYRRPGDIAALARRLAAARQARRH